MESPDVYGPILPTQTDSERSSLIGPVLPSDSEANDNTETEEKTYGPSLPPHLVNKVVIGPTLPPHLISKNEAEEDEDDDTYGPLPVGASSSSKAYQALEERALELKINNLTPNDNSGPIREEWMLELPEVKASKLGLGPRQFKKRSGPDLSDRSAWTDTPKDKAAGKSAAKIDLKKEAELYQLQKRNREQEEIADNHKKKRKHDKSLLKIHQDKLNAEKDLDEGKNVRRPFSREIDLKVNRFDEAQKKAILKKARGLDDKFAGGQSKFL